MTKQEAIDIHSNKRRDFNYGEYEQAKKIAIECIEKQIPKKPISRWTGNETVIECPNCRRYPFDLSEYQWARQFCGNCGQAIDWSDNE